MIHKYKIIFSDFDGTLTQDDELRPIFFDILNTIIKNEAELVIVSGRSLSWGHFFLTHLPVTHTIMEGGGVIQYKDERGLLQNDFQISEDEMDRLALCSDKLLQKFPNVNLSADSIGRKTDRAIELREVGLDSTLSNEIREFLDEQNVNHSTSNVDINFWCGEVSKYKAVTEYLKKYKNIDEQDCLYFGDSLNDESMFEHFPNTVGVANISKVIDQLKFKPSVVLMGKKMEGPSGLLHHLNSLVK